MPPNDTFDPTNPKEWLAPFKMLSGEEAAIVLADTPPGTFLLRKSKTVSEKYVLSLSIPKTEKNSNSVAHYYIEPTKIDGKTSYIFGGTIRFERIRVLLSHYKSSTLSQEYNVKLKCACPKENLERLTKLRMEGRTIFRKKEYAKAAIQLDRSLRDRQDLKNLVDKKIADPVTLAGSVEDRKEEAKKDADPFESAFKKKQSDRRANLQRVESKRQSEKRDNKPNDNTYITPGQTIQNNQISPAAVAAAAAAATANQSSQQSNKNNTTSTTKKSKQPSSHQTNTTNNNIFNNIPAEDQNEPTTYNTLNNHMSIDKKGKEVPMLSKQNKNLMVKKAERIQFKVNMENVFFVECLKDCDLWSKPMQLDQQMVADIRDELRLLGMNCF